MQARRTTPRGGRILFGLAVLCIAALSISAVTIAMWNARSLETDPAMARHKLAEGSAEDRRRAIHVLIADAWQTIDALDAARQPGDPANDQASIGLAHLRQRLNELR